ncbi:MAG TPA: lysylphosphatidylglycerol synthase domain-containing protein, partial [Pyrinomonadaceae bacterium]|nr:lysylphosphatidylglycerol synthase domain-containing protein [Pyrinomonadaceae bacterium]
MNIETKVQNPKLKTQSSKGKHLNRLKIIAVIFTIAGIALFSYFVYSVGVSEILIGIVNIGFGGFAVILLIYFLRICVRSIAWTLSVYEPYKLELRDTLPAVIIGEALSSLIPLGILISGTAKAVAVRKKVPLVVGLSSVATENLFYSLITGIFIAVGAFIFLLTFNLPDAWVLTIYVLLFLVFFFILFGFFIVFRQWHFASEFCEWLYERGIA